ncbi:MAG: putative photosynthetic complex assembly protein PuhE [Roseococcus sp.]
MEHVWPILYAVFVWWAGTALVFMLDQLPRRHHLRVMVGATLVLAAALWCVAMLDERLTAASAYAGFTCGVLVWAWQELAFLTGYVTGPNRRALPEGTEGFARFRAALGTVWHHELAMLALGLALLLLLWEAPNRTALWTYLLLWVMRQSAKLNIFLGARNLGESMLPPHLGHLASYFRRRHMNFLFPVSVTGGTLAAMWLGLQAAGASDPFLLTASTLLAALMALAVIEHWFLMLPLPLDGLWTWGRPGTSSPSPEARAKPRALPLRP